ncbi:ABC transporter permease, partial [Anaerotruncus rubiinfantis]
MNQEKTIREPFLRVVKRAERSPRQVMLLRAEALVLSIIAGGVFILMLGHNPFEIYGTILSGAFRSKMAIQATVKIMIPLLISSLGVTLAFKMRFWNIGAEGQIIAGAICASYFALFHSGWNHWVLILVMFAAGVIGGGLWGLIPAIFKVKWGTNETLFTLMLNYIALHMVNFLRDGPWKDPGSQGFPKIARFDANAALDKVLGVQFGWIIALVLVALVYIYLKYTKQGYEISVVGESNHTAQYAGMKVKTIMLRTMFLSGAVAGVAGMVQATGSDITLTNAVAGGVGFTAIIVAWLGQLNP